MMITNALTMVVGVGLAAIMNIAAITAKMRMIRTWSRSRAIVVTMGAR